MNILEQNNEKINGVLETFDRIIITGYLHDLCNLKHFNYYLIQNNILLKDFKSFAEEQTAQLCNHIDSFIKQNNVDLMYISSNKINKNDIAKKKLQENYKDGLIAAFSVIENCTSTTVKPNRSTNLLEVSHISTKCKHYYLYFNDSKFGFMFLKIQTWFPYNVQIYINGHEYLSKLFDKHNIHYEMYDNSFSYISDFHNAQSIADNILNKKLSSSLDHLVNQINIHLPKIQSIFSNSYYWCIDQCEFATDINFKSKEELTLLYKKLVETSFFTFHCDNIYSFFGRDIKYIKNFRNGDITSDLRNRYQGYRIKFKLNKNQVKMYDKGNNLRIEVTINNPKEFKILKSVENPLTGELSEEKKWLSMGKSITNLYRYVEISKSITNRFINALPLIDTSISSLNEIQNISKSTEWKNRHFSGFNVLNNDSLTLLEEISKGDYLISGFNNKSIRQALFEEPDKQKNISKTTRLLQKLRAHGIIKKVERKNTYYLTKFGRKFISNLLLFTKEFL